MTLLYAIGDIHGQKAMLDQALDLIAADGGADAKVVFLGDYTDRGPDSRAVVDTLIAGRDDGRNWHFVKGNHDRMFMRYLRDGREDDPRIASGRSWLHPRLGGPTTLASYGVIGTPSFGRDDSSGLELLNGFTTETATLNPAQLLAAAQDAVPQAHIDFLEGLPLIHETEDQIFVHAGLQMDRALDAQDEDDLLWIRAPFLESQVDYGRLIVHGHTALDAPQHYGNRLNLDGGAGYGRPLVPVVISGWDAWALTENGRTAITP